MQLHPKLDKLVTRSALCYCVDAHHTIQGPVTDIWNLIAVREDVVLRVPGDAVTELSPEHGQREDKHTHELRVPGDAVTKLSPEQGQQEDKHMHEQLRRSESSRACTQTRVNRHA